MSKLNKYDEAIELMDKGYKYDTLKQSHDKLLEDIQKTIQMINDEGEVGKWKIQAWLTGMA
jgi:hypothetical protein